MKYNPKQITINFENESKSSVSWETLNAMTAIVGVDSLEALIKHALARLKEDLRVSYPIDDAIPTTEHFTAMEELATEDMQLEVLSNLFEVNTGVQERDVNEFNLIERVAQITNENMHDHIHFCTTLEPNTTDEKIFKSDFLCIPYSNKASEVFTIQISLMPTEQLQELWRKQMRAIDNRQALSVTRHLSYEDWDDFLEIFSNKGKAMVEELRKG